MNLLFLRRYISFLFIFIFSTALFAQNLENVSIQLKWKHSFQFAGYYAAIEKGFYKDEGINVTLKEIDLSRNFIDDVINGMSQYGVSDSTLAVYYTHNKPVVLISQIFQHSPLVLLSHRDSNILTPYDLEGKKVMYSYKSTGAIPFKALILKTVGSFDNIDIVDFTSYDDFINRKVDVTSAYSTSQPYWLKKQGIEVNIIDPKSYGIDFYGDNFFTTQKELQEHPLRVEKMRKATIKGWKYALDHQDEIIDLIIKKYAPHKDKETLKSEAKGIYGMINPDLVEIGDIDKKRYQQVIKIYHQLGVIKNKTLDNNFFFQKSKKLELSNEELKWLKNNPMIRIAVMRYWKYDKDGNNLHTDILKLLNKYGHIGLKPIKFDTWASGFKEASEGKSIHGIDNISWSKEREEKYFYYTKPYDFSPNYLIVKKSSNIKSLKDLENKTIFLKKESIDHKIINDVSKNIKVIDVDTDEEMYEKLANSDDVVAFMSYAVDKEKLEKYNLKVATTVYGKYSQTYIAISKKHPLLQSILNKIFDIIPREELVALQNKKYDYQELQFNSIQKQWIQKHSIINFLGDNNWEPFSCLNKKTKKHMGIASDYIKIIHKKTGLTFNMIKKEDTNNIDLYPVSVKNNNSTDILFSDPYISYPVVIVTTNDKKFLPDISYLNNKTIVTVKNHMIVDTIKKDYPKIKIIEVKNINQAIKKISNSKAYAYLAALPTASYAINKNNYSNLKIAGKTKYNLDIRMAISKELGETGIEIINKVLTTITNEQKNKIYNRWVSVRFDKSIDYTLLWQISAIFLFFIIGTLYWNRKLTIEIQKRKESEQKLKIAKFKAQEASRSKSEFLANMSHEIRTPMNSVIGFTDLLSKLIKDPIQKDYLNSIQTGGKALMSIINDILDLSKIEAGKFHIDKEPINPRSLINEIQTMFQAKINQKNLSFILDIDENLPDTIIIDSVRIRQVLINIIGNAIKFTNKGTITLKVETKFKDNINDKFDLIISISDTGRGIPKKFQEKIFQAFEQTSAQDAKALAGTGLGLAISSKLVKLMNGEIKVESEVQKGSTFIITLHDIEIGHLEETQIEISNTNIEFDNATILVVDDIQANRKLVIATLSHNPFRFIQAQNGQEALDIVKEESNNIDLILMDLRMPVMNGYEATVKIKEYNQKIPIIAFTASVMNKDIEQIKEYGFDGYIRKPVVYNDLVKEFIKHLKYQEVKNNKYEIATEDLDQNIIENIPKVLEKLTTDYKIQLDEIKNKGDFTLIHDLMVQIQKLAQDNTLKLLEHYTDDILLAIDSFDIDKVNSLIANYDIICDELKKLYKENQNV